MKPDALQINGKKFYYEEIVNYSFRDSIPINGYEAKVLEFCRNWLNGQQEFVIHTSGSTGPPKNITLHRDQLEASAGRTLKVLRLQPGDRTLVCLNVEAISGLMMLVRGLVGNLDLTVIEPIANPLAFSKTEQPFDFISLVPYQLAAILQETPAKKLVLDYAKAILLGGAPVDSRLETQIRQLKAPVYLSYGMTETASHIALRRLNGPDRQTGFTALPGVLLGQDERGCLTIEGDITRHQKIITNDLVDLRDGTFFVWLGRADNTLNTGGYKVQLEKVEVILAQALMQLHLDCRSFVAAEPDLKLGNRLIAVLEGEAPGAETESLLQQEMAHLLSKYERPKAFYFIRSFVATPSGKIDKIATLSKINQTGNEPINEN
jgi:O-succinylbenzoic acid--CoA ligase